MNHQDYTALWSKGYYRVRQPVVRFKRLYAIAAERWADAGTPYTMAWWKFIMDRCVTVEYALRRVPNYKDGEPKDA